MSVCVTVRTDKSLEPKSILGELAKRGEQIVVTSADFPCVKFGNHGKAIRGIEVTQQENGYEVRVCTFSSVADYLLLAKTIFVLKELSGGRSYYEDEDESEILCPLEYFDEEWIERQRESDFEMCSVMIRNFGEAITMFGLFCDFCVGPSMLQRFGFELSGTYDKGKYDALQKYLCSAQWYFEGKEDTSTRMVMPSPTGDERALSISMISISDGEVSPFDYISYADILGIMDMDHEEEIPPVLIPFEHVWKILPQGVFELFDEFQFERKGELTVDMVHEMMEAARKYQPLDFHYKPTCPGRGYDEKQNTFVLMWNPAISSVTLDDHKRSIGQMLTEYFNWSVWEYQKAKYGDRFYLVRVGDGNTGIVMSGVFVSNPYEDSDWSGRGRKTYYMDMRPNVILDSDVAPYISTQQLQETIPSFDWSKGHSGRLLSADKAKKIEGIWHEYLENHSDEADGVGLNIIKHW